MCLGPAEHRTNPVFSPSLSPELLLCAECLACPCFGVIISLFISWENSLILFQIEHFFCIYFSHPIVDRCSHIPYFIRDLKLPLVHLRLNT